MDDCFEMNPFQNINTLFQTNLCSSSTSSLNSFNHNTIYNNYQDEVVLSKETKSLSYYCKICSYTATRQSHFIRHCSSLKHQNTIKRQHTLYTMNIPSLLCSYCHKLFRHESSLSRHKKICEKKNDLVYQNQFVKTLIKQNEDLLMENKEFKQLMMDFLKSSTQKQEMTVHAIQHIENNTHTNSHNKQFNLNFFLNETCKNAMNMSEFIDSLVIKAEEFEDMGKLGYVQGISNILIRGLKELDETDRPMHCTDKKRETLYIKENNVWEKDTPDKSKVKKIIHAISNKNFKHIALWKQENPASNDFSSKKHIEYMQILQEVMTSISPDDEQGFHKIIRNVAHTVCLDNAKSQTQTYSHI